MPQIKITVGAVSIEYDGDQSYIENGLADFLDNVIQKSGSVPQIVSNSQAQTAASASPSLALSTNTIAQNIGVKTGSELALAAIAKINLVKGQSAAARQEVLDEMREATTYFKDSYVSNLSAYLDTLVKSRRVNLVAKATYALAAAERKRLEGLLAAAGDMAD